MLGQLQLPGDHVSRLDLSVALRGISVQQAASSVGITLGGEREPLAPVRPEHYEQSARIAESAAGAGETTVAEPGPNATVIRVAVGRDGLLARATRCRAAAAMRAEQPRPAPLPGEIHGISPVAGGWPVVGATALAPADASLAPVVPLRAESGSEAGDSDGAEAEDEDEAAVRGLRERMMPLEVKLAELTPGLQRVSDLAEAEGVYLSGLLVALAPLVLATVPPFVMLPPASGLLAKE